MSINDRLGVLVKVIAPESRAGLSVGYLSSDWLDDLVDIGGAEAVAAAREAGDIPEGATDDEAMEYLRNAVF